MPKYSTFYEKKFDTEEDKTRYSDNCLNFFAHGKYRNQDLSETS